MKKIAIIGAGVVGINCILRLIDERDQDTKITWIYDSSVPIFGIGESTTSGLPSQIAFSTNIVLPHIRHHFDSTIKYGNKFVGWGKRKDKNFVHWFDLERHGMHFDTKMFSDFFIENITKITPDLELRNEKINSIKFFPNGVFVNTIPYDYVIDCTGGNSLIDHDEYFDAPIRTVNTCLAARIDKPADWGVTIAYAHRNGWMFGIPLNTRRTWGYCYNSEITTEEEALADFKSIIPDVGEYRKIQWKQRLSTYLVHPSGRYARNGNAVGFIEPIESLAGAYYDEISDQIVEHALQNNPNDLDKIDDLNEWYYEEIVDDWLKCVSWLYQFGSRYDSPFWNRTSEECRDYLNDPEIFDISILDDLDTFTDDLFVKIADDKDMLEKFVSNDLKELGHMPSFVNSYRDFLELTLGMGAPYAHKFPILTPPIDPPEPHGQLAH